MGLALMITLLCASAYAPILIGLWRLRVWYLAPAPEEEKPQIF